MPATFKKMAFRDAKALLNSLCVMLDGKPASTNKNPSELPNPDGMGESWWIENDETFPPFDSPRAKHTCEHIPRSRDQCSTGPGFHLNGA